MIQLVIEIDDTTYKMIKDSIFFISGRLSTRTIEYSALKAIYDGKPLPKGHWKSTIDGKPICSECGFISESIDGYFVSNFCPSCGARMKGDDKCEDEN